MPFIGKQPKVGAYQLIDSITTSATATYALTVDGSAYFPETARNLIVSLNGVTQAPESAYTVSGSNIVFDSALTTSDVIDYILVIGDAVDIGVPSDGTVGNAQLASSIDLSGKTITLANDQISGDAIDGGTISNFASTGIDDNATSTAITIDSNENVGIKVTSPASALHVKDADAVITIQDTAGTLGQIEWMDSSNNILMNMRSGGSDFVTDLEAGGDWIYRNSGTQQMRIEADGSVLLGSGSVSPSCKLTAEGSARFHEQETGLQVYLSNTTNWVKVFERHYYAASSFNYGSHNLLVSYAGATNGHGGALRLHIVTKQQSTSDNFDVQFVEGVGEVTGQVAYRYDSSGGDNSGGLLTVWVRPSQQYMSVAVHSDVVGLARQYDAGIAFAENTGSSTMPTGATEIYSNITLKTNGEILFNRTSTPNVSNAFDGGWRRDLGSLYLNCPSATGPLLLNQTTGDTATRNEIRFFRNETQVGSVTANTTTTFYNTTSDYRVKENVVPLENALDRIKQIPVRRFNFIADPDTTVDGFIAHEVAEFVPEAIYGEKDGMETEEYEVTPEVINEMGEVVEAAVMGTREVPEYQGIDQSKLVPLLTAAIQEQQAIIEDLQTRLSALEAN